MIKNCLKVALILLAGACSPLFAITFTEPQAESWIWMEDFSQGCVARLTAANHNNIYVGSCKDRIPHGRGIYFSNLKKYAARANNGKLYKTENYSATDSELNLYHEKAGYIAGFHSIFLLSDNFDAKLPTPENSDAYRAGKLFIEQYAAVANELDLAQVKQIQEISKQAAYVRVLENLKLMQTSYDAQQVLTAWKNLLNSEQVVEITQLKNSFAAEEKRKADKEAQIAAENARISAEKERKHQAWRTSRIATACNDFYPGYVGEYDSGGWLSTADAYVVRYVNAGRRTVTIEGTHSGNSLSYGQIKELSCIDLLERTK